MAAATLQGGPLRHLRKRDSVPMTSCICLCVRARVCKGFAEDSESMGWAALLRVHRYPKMEAKKGSM